MPLINVAADGKTTPVSASVNPEVKPKRETCGVTERFALQQASAGRPSLLHRALARQKSSLTDTCLTTIPVLLHSSSFLQEVHENHPIQMWVAIGSIAIADSDASSRKGKRVHQQHRKKSGYSSGKNCRYRILHLKMMLSE